MVEVQMPPLWRGPHGTKHCGRWLAHDIHRHLNHSIQTPQTWTHVHTHAPELRGGPDVPGRLDPVHPFHEVLQHALVVRLLP
jgi:hypothetical protein